jgi:hypothetical protein
VSFPDLLSGLFRSPFTIDHVDSLTLTQAQRFKLVPVRNHRDFFFLPWRGQARVPEQGNPDQTQLKYLDMLPQKSKQLPIYEGNSYETQTNQTTTRPPSVLAATTQENYPG